MKFYFTRNEKNIELDIIKKITDYAVLATLVVNGEIIAYEKKASICAKTQEPGKLFLQFSANDVSMQNGYGVFLCICDLNLEKGQDFKFIEKNREIATYISENIQNGVGISYGFSIDHCINWED